MTSPRNAPAGRAIATEAMASAGVAGHADERRHVGDRRQGREGERRSAAGTRSRSRRTRPRTTRRRPSARQARRAAPRASRANAAGTTASAARPASGRQGRQRMTTPSTMALTFSTRLAVRGGGVDEEQLADHAEAAGEHERAWRPVPDRSGALLAHGSLPDRRHAYCGIGRCVRARDGPIGPRPAMRRAMTLWSGRVRISGPSSVMAMVCSVWAARPPVGGDDGPLVVEELGVGRARRRPSAPPRSVCPAPSLRPLPGLAPVGDVGLPRAWPCRCRGPCTPRTTEKPAASATPCTAAPMSESRPPRLHRLDPGRERRLGDVDEALRLGVDLPDAGGEGGVAVPALDDRPAVDGDEVALLEPVRRRGCRARSRRSGTRRSPPGTAGGCSRGSWTARPAGRSRRGRSGRAPRW